MLEDHDKNNSKKQCFSTENLETEKITKNISNEGASSKSYNSPDGSAKKSDGSGNQCMSFKNYPTSTQRSERIFPTRSLISVDSGSTEGSQSSSDAAIKNRTTKSSTEGVTSGKSAESSFGSGREGSIASTEYDFDSIGCEDGVQKAYSNSSNENKYGGYQLSSISGDSSSSTIITASQGFLENKSISKSDECISGHVSIDEKVESNKQTYAKTVKFKSVETKDGHVIITGHSDKPISCEAEPIHAPGAIQGFGALVAVKEAENGDLIVRMVSENSMEIIGNTPEELFNLKSFTELLDEEGTEILRDHLSFIRERRAEYSSSANSEDEISDSSDSPDIFSLSGRCSKNGDDKEDRWSCWVAMHIAPNKNGDYAILEFELQHDEIHPLVSADNEFSDLESNPDVTEEDIEESTKPIHRPMRPLTNKRFNPNRLQSSSLDHFSLISQINDQLSRPNDLKTFLKVVVGIVKEISGFHRVMVYQFDEKWNGQVVSELVDWNKTHELYLGLHFPASDIPSQARMLYKLNTVRVLYDRDLPTSRLVCRTIEDLEQPLNMTYSFLRAMSPIHLKYLENMHVRSSMSISIIAFGELWGLISLHGFGNKGLRVNFILREMCRVIGESVSRNVERLSLSRRLQSRKLINTTPSEKNPAGYIVTRAEDLLSLFDADVGVLSIGEEGKIMGTVEKSQELMVVIQFLRLKRFTTIQTSVNIIQDFSDLKCKEKLEFIAGFLLVPLSKDGNDFIVFFRKGQLELVHWAGNPQEKIEKSGPLALMPRQSFKIWSETILGRCREWTDEQLETAAVLHLVYGKFIEVWRQKEEAVQSKRLASLLLDNASHEVRTPLNAIINYLEIALEGSLDKDTRDNLTRSHAASKSLVYVINDLLDLTRSEAGKVLFRSDLFHLPNAIKDALRMFEGHPMREGIQLECDLDESFPRLVFGDPGKTRQVISNVISNALKFTSEGKVIVKGSTVERQKEKVIVEISISDTGSGMTEKKLDAIFKNFEQIGSDDPKESDEGTGLGLAIVARFVRNMNGQLKVESEVNKGSIFTFIFTFPLPNNTQAKKYSSMKSGSSAQSLKSNSNNFQKSSTGHQDSITTSGSELARTSSFESASETSLSGSSYPEISNLVEAMGGYQINDDRSYESFQSALSTQSSGSWHIPREKRSGEYHVEGQRMPVRPVRMDHDNDVSSRKSEKVPFSDFFSDMKLSPEKGVNTKISSPSFDSSPAISDGKLSNNKNSMSSNSKRVSVITISQNDCFNDKNLEVPNQVVQKLRILVAEDDPINRRILKKRLEMDGHKVSFANDGQEAVIKVLEPSMKCDIVLMDLQMPICDGVTATIQIRRKEKDATKLAKNKKQVRENTHKIPIFAVSASLPESRKQDLEDAGFDGWVLKPIDFGRLRNLLIGVYNLQSRAENKYKNEGRENWERGGWLV